MKELTETFSHLKDDIIVGETLLLMNLEIDGVLLGVCGALW